MNQGEVLRGIAAKEDAAAAQQAQEAVDRYFAGNNITIQAVVSTQPQDDHTMGRSAGQRWAETAASTSQLRKIDELWTQNDIGNAPASIAEKAFFASVHGMKVIDDDRLLDSPNFRKGFAESAVMVYGMLKSQA